MYNVKIKILSCYKFLLLFIVACSLMPANLHATDNKIYLGGQADHNGKPMLDIQILPNGKWIVYRKAGGAYYKQFYQESLTHIFA
ncbi:MAG: hypothetical protein LBJ58_01015, partial [Tannerellaceae bacterium]|nr:hypothetical protein [Tannerellaceae bacterium]